MWTNSDLWGSLDVWEPTSWIFFYYYRAQRRRYHAIRERAETDRSMLSLIVDGMDQNATNLPHFKRKGKSAVNLWHLRTHVTGAIVHGSGCFTYCDILQWPHDPNLTMNVFLHLLLTQFKTIKRNELPLPKKLYIQLDNCMSENKNRHVLGFLSLLVANKVFDEVSKLNFQRLFAQVFVYVYDILY